MYAIDEYGNLFAKNSRALNGVGYFNHSSFNAGKDILCAGMLETLNTGELVMISNQSGHYTPPRQNLWDAVDYLVTEGVNTTNTMVQLYEKSTTGFANGVDQAGMAQQMVPGIYRHDFTVAQFHANYLLRAPAPILRHRA